MNEHHQELKTFYDLVRCTSRTKTLDWLTTLPPEVFIREHEQFAYGSLRRIFAHVAACYLLWVGRVGLGEDRVAPKVENVDDLRTAFARVDATVTRALETFQTLDEPFDIDTPQGTSFKATRRWLILHPITHEFHHKGQALALARVLGHPYSGDQDTDLDPSC